MSEVPDGLLSAAERGVRAARQAGADAAEIYVWAGRSWETRTAGKLRTVQESDQSGIGVRVAVDGRRASATTSGTLEDGLEWAVQRAVSLARLMPRTDAAWVLPEPAELGRPPTRVDGELVDPSADRMLGMVDDATDALTRLGGLDYAAATVLTHEGRFAVANTNGVLAWDQNAHEVFMCEMRGEGQGESRTMTTLLQERRAVDRVHDVAGSVQAAAQRALEQTAAVRLDEPVRDVVLDAQCAAQLLLGILPSFAGNAANDRRSRFANALGQRVASEGFTLIDNPTDGLGLRNHRCDDQGSPTVGALPLIEKGILRYHVHDVASAAKAGTSPTGHGLRPLNGRYGAPPKTRVANATVQPGDLSFEELVAGCDRSVLVEGNLLGSFTMNPLTGDFSCTAPIARLVESGKPGAPLKPVTLGGNVFDALKEIRGLGRDTKRFPRGACPSIRLGGMTAST